jgi:hypothetical protein
VSSVLKGMKSWNEYPIWMHVYIPASGKAVTTWHA